MIEKLYQGEVHVWRGLLDQPADVIAKLYSFLSYDESQRAERCYKKLDNLRYASGRGILRVIISKYLLIAPNEIQFVYNKYGKPFISPDQNTNKLMFNISHSNGVILCAFGVGRRIGVDLEFIREEFASIEIAERFFSSDEVCALKALPTDKLTNAFFNCWTRKESFIKAVGMGISYPLDKFTVSLDPNHEPALLKVNENEKEPLQWKMFNINVGKNFAASVIAENPPVNLKLLDWSVGF